MAKRKKNTIDDPVVRELDSIKRLLVLQLLISGVSQGEVALALQVDQSVVSRMFPARNLRSIKKRS